MDYQKSTISTNELESSKSCDWLDEIDTWIDGTDFYINNQQHNNDSELVFFNHIDYFIDLRKQLTVNQKQELSRLILFLTVLQSREFSDLTNILYNKSDIRLLVNELSLSQYLKRFILNQKDFWNAELIHKLCISNNHELTDNAYIFIAILISSNDLISEEFDCDLIHTRRIYNIYYEQVLNEIRIYTNVGPKFVLSHSQRLIKRLCKIYNFSNKKLLTSFVDQLLTKNKNYYAL